MSTEIPLMQPSQLESLSQSQDYAEELEENYTAALGTSLGH